MRGGAFDDKVTPGDHGGGSHGEGKVSTTSHQVIMMACDGSNGEDEVRSGASDDNVTPDDHDVSR